MKTASENDEAHRLARRRRRRLRMNRSMLNLDAKAERIAKNEEDQAIADWLNKRTRSDGASWSVKWTPHRVHVLKSRHERKMDGESTDDFSPPELGDGQPWATDEAIRRKYSDGDRDGLAELFLGELRQWGWDVLNVPSNRRLAQRRADLHPELVADGSHELVFRATAIVGRGYTPGHIRRSLRQSCKAQMRIFLDQLPVASASSRTTRDRRARERKGERLRPNVEYRPVDMPPKIEPNWSGYFHHEPSLQVGLPKWFDKAESDPWDEFIALKASIDAERPTEPAFDRCDCRSNWRLLVAILIRQAERLSRSSCREKIVGKKLQKAIRWMLNAEWNDKRRKWRKRSLSDAARSVGLGQECLREELEVLALQIVCSLDGPTLEMAKEWFAVTWPEILEIPTQICQNRFSTAISIDIRAAIDALREVEGEVRRLRALLDDSEALLSAQSSISEKSANPARRAA